MMEINRDNYELYFLLYTDNELDAAEQKAVEAFVDLHADLKEELNMLLQTRLSTHDDISFLKKESLYRTPGKEPAIDTDHYEAYFLLYADNELHAEERRAVEHFVEKYPLKRAELQRILQAKIQPDDTIIFPGKASLYKTKKTPASVFALPWQRIVAAASIVAIGSWLWINIQPDMPQQATDQPLSKRTTPPAPPQQVQRHAATETPLPGGIKENTEKSLSQTTRTETIPLSSKHKDHLPGTVNHNINTASIPATNGITQNQASHPTGNIEQVSDLPAEDSGQPAPVLPAPETIEANHHIVAGKDPVIPDQSVFKQRGDESKNENITAGGEDLAYWDSEKKSKKKLRGLVRRASRYVEQFTASHTKDNQAIVRVAGFEITRKD